MRGRTVKEHLREKMQDPEFQKAWHGLDEEFQVLEGITRTREEGGPHARAKGLPPSGSPWLAPSPFIPVDGVPFVIRFSWV
jgi:hypothetical protein